MRREIKYWMFGGLLVAGSVNALAQDPSKSPAVDGEVFRVLASQPLPVDVIKGAPYSATATTEIVQTLSDGNQIVQRNETRLYRDSAGRTRLEQSLNTIGRWRAATASTLITINDPVARVAYTLDPSTLTAHQSIVVQKPLTPRWTGSFSLNGRALSREEFEEMAQRKLLGSPGSPGFGGTIDPSDPNAKQKLTAIQPGKTGGSGQSKRESLGAKVMEGIQASGTRVTVVIPAGDVGNKLPLEIVDETWFSPDLQMNLMTTHRDPRSGETTYKLTNLSRGEPAPDLFAVPAGYALKSAKPARTAKP